MINLPPLQSYHPATFLERGVAVPFTTPMLLGARARPAERGGAELIVPSPSGGRGVYILPWPSVRMLCRPTVHDCRLNALVEALPSVTPSLIRQAARQVSVEGLAGHDAVAAAQIALQAEREAILLTNFRLVVELVRQVDPSRGDPASSSRDEIEQAARRSLALLAPRIGRSPDEIAALLEEMAPWFEPIGIGSQAADARFGRMLRALRQLRTEMTEWHRGHSDESGTQAEMVATVSDITITCAETTLRHAQALLADLPNMLRAWSTDLQAFISRPEWLLDGWEQVCLLWGNAATDAARRAILPELILLIPMIPQEAAQWVNVAIDMDRLMRFRRTVQLNEDWRTGTAVPILMARNERLRAQAA